MTDINLIDNSHLFDQDYSVLRQKPLEKIYDEIGEVYLANKLPWVVGWSGGKDSTATLQLIWYALSRLPAEKLTKQVYVVASDTLVEAPAIVKRIYQSIDRMNEAAMAAKLPITAHIVTPEVDESFWVNLIGRGYPAPYQRFRWCTERMKIKPNNRFILKKVTEYGEAIVALGVRKAESFTREQSINLHKITGSRLSSHSMLPGAYIYTPIEDFTVKDVWDYLLLEPNPWGVDNMNLRELYESADGECPLVIDTLTPSCGNTRFGCWVCTVVNKDKSMEAMIESGEEWMRPMLEFRNALAETQDPTNKLKIRSLIRRNGQVWIKEGKLIPGPFEFEEETIAEDQEEFRKSLLRFLLRTQNEVRELSGNPEMQLITEAEIHAIRRIWRTEEDDWEDVLPQIYREETGEDLDWVQDDTGIFGVLEEKMLAEICEGRTSKKLVKKLLGVEQSYYGMRRRYKIYDKFEAAFKRDYRNKEEVLRSLAEGEATYLLNAEE